MNVALHNLQLKHVGRYLVSEDEFLFPAFPLNQVKPTCRRAQRQPLPRHGQAGTL